MALNEEKLGWTTEFSGIWTFGITVYRPIWFPYILRGFYLLANVETFQILHESKWLATQVHIVVFFLAYLQKSVLRRQRLWRDLPCVSSVVCKCSQNARYDCFMQVGFEDMTVVKLFLIARILIACDCGCDKHLVNTLTTSQALNVRRFRQAATDRIPSLKGIPTPRASYGHQFSVSCGHHFVEWSPRFFFSVVSRASTARCWGNWKSITLKNRIPCRSTCCIWAAQSLVSLMPQGRAVCEHIIRRIISRVNN